MKRIIILIDGTWNLEAQNANTNIGLLDPKNGTLTGVPLIPAQGADGIVQEVAYHCGVGSNQGGLAHWLAGMAGTGLKQLVLEAYDTLAKLFKAGDDIIILGFSRGAYAARALAGMIGAAGIVQVPSDDHKEAAWATYRAKPANRSAALKAMAAAPVHADRRIRCVGVFETVGSYGVPAGFGDISQIGTYLAWKRLGFHDTSFGDHIEVGLHALGIDERRRPFVPTFWTIPKGQQPVGRVEQTWFAGDHGGVGGGHPDTRLSNQAMIWMIARLQALAGVYFDQAATQALNASQPLVDGEVYDSTEGWLLDHAFPHLRQVLSPDAIVHGPLSNAANPEEEHINERVHWSLARKIGRRCQVFGTSSAYEPKNWPGTIPADKRVEMTPEEAAIYGVSWPVPWP